MAFPTAEALGQPDPRFLDMVRIIDGCARPMELADQHEAMVTLELSVNIPPEVRASFDRGRSIFLFAWYDYELFVPAESQALAALEMALQMKLCAIGHEMNGTMRNLVEKARKCGIIPPMLPGMTLVQDPFEALIRIRNSLAHGTTDVHTPAIAFGVLEACAIQIKRLYA